MNTHPRLAWSKIAPKAYQAMANVNASIAGHTLGARLFDLVQTRVSQLNGCAFCLDMHVRDLRTHGEDWQRINSLATWREVGLYDDRERAALDWAEQLTQLPGTHGNHAHHDAAFAALQGLFTDVEIVDLTVAIAQINAWNRLGVGMRLPVPARPIE